MLKTENSQNMNQSLHKALEKQTHVELTAAQTVLNKALQYPILLAPPPTPTKHRGQAASETDSSSDSTSPHFPDHLRCGEVFTWHCEGEFYAVECRLCDDHPLCPLSEFPLHMEAWHTDWSGKLKIDGEDLDDEDDDDEDQNDLYHVLALSPLNEDSGLCDYDHEHGGFESSTSHQLLSPSSVSSSHEEEEDVLEPFEQVLIEQDNTVDTTQIKHEDGGEELVTEGGKPTASVTTPQTTVIVAVAPASSSNNNTDHEENEVEQHLKAQPKQYNAVANSFELQTEIPLQTLSPLKLSHKEEQPLNTVTADEGETGDIRELREYIVCLNNKEFTLSDPNNIIMKEEAIKRNDHEAEVTSSLANNDDAVAAAKESYNDKKQEIPPQTTAGEIVDPKQDLQHFTISSDTSEEILKIPQNVATTTTKGKRGRKRKSKETERDLKSEKILESFDKLMLETETENKGRSKAYPASGILTPQSSPSSQAATPKRRKTYSRACKRNAPTKANPEEKQEDDTMSQSTEQNPHCNTYTFLSPASSSTGSASPDQSSSYADKASKIRYLVKQCERIAREHQSSASSTISSSSAASLQRSTAGRRSLTPVEVCDILPTVPLNDNSISIYDTGNMSPQALSEHLESLACSLLDYDDFPDDDRSVTSTALTNETIAESSPFSPGSPKSEEEHFEFHEPKEKLNRTHVLQLIELYKEHSRLWDQTHTEFCEPQLCRKSWEEITACWNVFCNRNFTITEVRIRISTLCQRYIKERERIHRESELDESAKFPYYEQMSFLEEHRSLQKRREVYEQQNETILEVYKKYLLLWHVRWYKVRQVKERTKAYQSMSAELKERGIYLSSTGVQKRIRSLRKCYRLEKIRHLHAQVERLKFESTFKHYERMQFLDKHIDPFVCRICGKIFESLLGFKEHLESVNHGNILEEEDDDGNAEVSRPDLEAQAADAVLCGTNEKFEISMNTKDPNSVSVFIKPLAISQEVEIYTSETGCDTLNPLPMDDIIIEEIIENVSNEDAFATKSLDKYLHLNDSSDGVSFYIDPANNSATNLDLENIDVRDADTPPDSKAKKREEVIPNLDGSTKYNKVKAFRVDEEYHSGDGDTQSARLNDDEIRTMISIYRKYRPLWDPNDLDYNSRASRRQSWFALTTEFNKAVHRNFSWRSLYRKLIDYAKYYKKLTSEQNSNEIKWVFYQDLMFLDDVISVSNELAKAIHQPETTLKLIEIYRSIPQLWNIRDADFNKRPVKQRNINIMCNRLQEETNQQINPERIKNRLIELRTQYRTAKKKRLRCLKTKQKFFPDFEYYEQFEFIDAHIDPFECDLCSMDFKRLTDFNRHMRKEHEPKRRRFRNVDETDATQRLDSVCHICGVKFSNRGNLGHHLLRHQGVRNFECSLCPKKFFTSHSLKIHVRTHTKECPYICEKCGLSFVNASKLNQHVLRHTNQKDFKCDHCPKAFYTAFERDRHTRWHLNIRDKNCPICGKSFVKGSSYYAHLMLHSDKKRFECDKCEMKFAQYAGLYKHKKRYHST